MTKGCILAIQESTVLMDDEELGRSAVRVIGTCHGDDTSHMRNIIFHTICRELTFDGLLRTAGSVSIGIAALDHESGDDAMESQTIVEAFICQIDKVGYRNRGSICIQFQRNSAIILHIDGHMMKTCEQLFALPDGQARCPPGSCCPDIA